MPPFVGVGVNVTAFPEQILVEPLAAIATEGVRAVAIVMVKLFDVTVLLVTQDSSVVISQVMTSPLTKSDAV